MDASTLFKIALITLLLWQLGRMFLGKVSPDKAKELVAHGARLLDVRSPGEFSSGHVRGALNIPVGELGRRLSDVGDTSRPVVVYCASGVRSASAASALRRAGYTVYDLGAMSRWPG